MPKIRLSIFDTQPLIRLVDFFYKVLLINDLSLFLGIYADIHLSFIKKKYYVCFFDNFPLFFKQYGNIRKKITITPCC